MREWSNFYFFFEAFVRAGVFLLTIVFVFGFWNDCWCAPPWQWQIGALTLFMAYINILLTLKRMPILGVPITMLLNIVVTFIKLIYLPVLLILAFAIPFYMVFVRQVSLYCITIYMCTCMFTIHVKYYMFIRTFPKWMSCKSYMLYYCRVKVLFYMETQ